MALKVTQFVALVLTALALVPAGAHLFELPNKIGLSQDRYFIVQSIYRGWALFFGLVFLSAVASTLVLAIMLRGQGAAFWLSTLAFLCMASSLAIFLCGRTRRTRQPTIGQLCLRIGKCLEHSGNTPTRRTRQ